MPELPEVEVASRQLRAWARGRRVVSVEVARSRVIRGCPPRRFEALEGCRFEEVERRGKWMVLRFEGGLGVLSHLGMTGKWLRRRAGEPAPSHLRASLALDDGQRLDYRDPRLFGRLACGPVEALWRTPGLAALGPDPLGGVDLALLRAALARTRRSIKEALMDQRTLAGLGNIHVGESLHRARLHPGRPANGLSRAEVARLAAAIDDSLRVALEREDGPEPIQYVEEGGENRFLVYAREGEPCPRCRTAIERIVQGGRSTFLCPRCQPPPRRAARRARRPGALRGRGR